MSDYEISAEGMTPDEYDNALLNRYAALRDQCEPDSPEYRYFANMVVLTWAHPRAAYSVLGGQPPVAFDGESC